METVCDIDDQTLAGYIPLLGDRVALRNLCSRYMRTSVKRTIRRGDIFKILKQKMLHCDGMDISNTDSTEYYRKSGKRVERKQSRRVEMGWIHNKVQVRKRKGGGTRKLDVRKDADKTELIEIGKQLFFFQRDNHQKEIWKILIF